MSLGPDTEPLTLNTELTTPEADAAWQSLAKKHNLIVPSLAELLGNSAVRVFSQDISAFCIELCMYVNVCLPLTRLSF